jgi:nitroimidazol reductase NimA-like FMN-containing flavoprotein (pyridoxamine 5'-phosphate oxidase superfamily)
VAHETPEDLAELQRLLDESHAAAGTHLLRIFSDERRVSAADLPARLPGVQVLHLATVTARGEPRVAPVDGLFYRGRFYFGSAADSLRFRNIRARPSVSATVTHGEEFAVVVHGQAVEVDPRAPESSDFRDYLNEAYNGEWVDRGPLSPYARIDAEKMFTFGGVSPASAEPR